MRLTNSARCLPATPPDRSATLHGQPCKNVRGTGRATPNEYYNTPHDIHRRKGLALRTGRGSRCDGDEGGGQHSTPAHHSCACNPLCLDPSPPRGSPSPAQQPGRSRRPPATNAAKTCGWRSDLDLAAPPALGRPAHGGRRQHGRAKRGRVAQVPQRQLRRDVRAQQRRQRVLDVPAQHRITRPKSMPSVMPRPGARICAGLGWQPPVGAWQAEAPAKTQTARQPASPCRCLRNNPWQLHAAGAAMCTPRMLPCLPATPGRRPLPECQRSPTKCWPAPALAPLPGQARSAAAHALRHGGQTHARRAALRPGQPREASGRPAHPRKAP